VTKVTKAIELRGVGLVTSMGLGTAAIAQALAGKGAGFRTVDETGWAGVDGRIYEGGFLETEVLGGLHRKVRDVQPHSLHARIVALGGAALAQLAPLLDDDAPVPIMVGIPAYAGVPPKDLVEHLMRQAQVRLDVTASVVIAGGHDAGLRAIHQACLALQGGRPGPIIAGGIDSFFEYPRLLERDLAERRARHNLDGRMHPGEGAGLLLLGRDPKDESEAAVLRIEASGAADPRAAVPVAMLGGRALVAMPAPLAAQAGTTATARPCLPVLGKAGVGACGLAHGELVDDATDPLACPMWRIGDTGPALGPIVLGLAAHAMASGPPPSPRACYGFSDDGGCVTLWRSPPISNVPVQRSEP
jgi:3-oxoacyl-[acyl-carrier-protein] synthase-1